MRIVTERLIIREALPTDHAFVLKLLNDPNYISMIRDSGVRDEEAAIKYIEETYTQKYQENGFGLYITEMISNSEAIGICGYVKREGLTMPDLGFAVLSEYTGKGYTQEAVKEVLKYGKKSLGFTEVAAITTDKNIASTNVLLKIGFQLKGKIKIPKVEKDFNLFIRTL